MRTCLCLLTLALTASAHADPLIYEGELGGADPFAEVDLRFTLHDAPADGEAIWSSDPITVALDAGRFVAEIEAGPAGALQPRHFAGPRWLQVTVLPAAGGEVPLAPRQRIGRVPLSFVASETPIRGLRPDLPATSCSDVLTSGGAVSGVYWITHPDPDQRADGPVEVYCDQVTQGGGWALLYNSVIGVNTTDFWLLSYEAGDHLARFGQPSVVSNFYDGSLYLPVAEAHYRTRQFIDVVEDLRGRTEVVAWVRARTFDAETMGFIEVGLVDPEVGLADWAEMHFRGTWGAADYPEGNLACAEAYRDVAQHYDSCWLGSLGADSILDDGPVDDERVGPHIGHATAEDLGLAVDKPDDRATRVRRISRFVRW